MSVMMNIILLCLTFAVIITINRQSHAFSYIFGTIVHVIVKIVLCFASCNYTDCLVQLFPNCTQMHAITYTNSTLEEIAYWKK